MFTYFLNFPKNLNETSISPPQITIKYSTLFVVVVELSQISKANEEDEEEKKKKKKKARKKKKKQPDDWMQFEENIRLHKRSVRKLVHD